MTTIYNKILNYALVLLGQRRYSERKLVSKLKTKYKDSETEISEVLKRLKEWKYIDDLEYANAYIHKVLSIGAYGKFYINQKLKSLGISAENIQKAFENTDINEEILAEKALKKLKFSRKNNSMIKKKQKFVYFLKCRGFDNETIYKLLEKITITNCIILTFLIL